MILEPNTPSSLDFSLNNPSDPATYFIQAKVRAVVSNTVIGTYNLSLVTGQYYRSAWTTPVDASGVGYEIAILFSVYTDAGYTQISPVYGTTMEKYVVRHLAAQNLGGFTQGGGTTVDYKKIEKIIRAILAEAPKLDPYDDMPVMQAIHELHTLVEDREAKTDQEKSLIGIRQNELLNTIAGHVNEIKGHVSKEVASINDRIEDSDANAAGRHQESISGHKATHAGLKTLGDDHETMAGQLNDHDEASEGRHKEAMTGIGKPISLKLSSDLDTVDHKPEAPEEKKPEDQSGMTVQKLIEMSNMQTENEST